MPKDKDEAELRREMLGDDTPALEAALDVEGGEDDDDRGAVEAALRAEGIDPHHPILSVDEQRDAIRAAQKRVAADSKKEAMKALEQKAYDEARGRSGLRTGDPVKDEMVTVTLDLAEHSDCLRVNGTPFWHGHTYTVPRHVAESLREMQQRGHNHQADLDGKGLSERGKKPRLTMVRTDAGGNILGIDNAPSRAA